jgi:organic hydroperoxide reductase OsmC/OhrA
VLFHDRKYVATPTEVGNNDKLSLNFFQLMALTHSYQLQLCWTGNQGKGTRHYTAYERSYTISIEGKDTIHGSSDPVFRGDASKVNPEEFLLAALSSCHLLWFLHLCADEGIQVNAYRDNPIGTMLVNRAGGGGSFQEVVLHPKVETDSHVSPEHLLALHHKAGALCFIANSVNFAVRYEPVYATR